MERSAQARCRDTRGKAKGPACEHAHPATDDNGRAQEAPRRDPRPQASMNPKKRKEIFRRLRAANPNPTTELEYRTPFELLVAVVLSAQANDKSVNLATRKLYPATPQKIVKLGVAGLEPYVKSIG